MTDWWNRSRAKQLVSFDGLKYGSITPTDIDGIIELKNIGYILTELKYRDKDVPDGQRLCLQRMVDDFAKAGKRSLCIICEHDTDNTDEDVILAETMAREIYIDGHWYPATAGTKVQDIIDSVVGRWTHAR